MSNKKTLAEQVTLLSYLGTKRLNQRGFPLPDKEQMGEVLARLVDFEDDALAGIFASIPVREVYKACRRYFDEYQELPDKTNFKPFLERDSKYQTYKQKASATQLEEMLYVVRNIHNPITNPKRMKQAAVRLLTNVLAQHALMEVRKNLKEQPDEWKANMSEAIGSFQKIRTMGMEIVEGKTTDIQDVMVAEPDFDALAAEAPLLTCFSTVRLAKARTSVVLSSSKKGKTRFCVSIAGDFYDRGIDICYVDFENGTVEMRLRFYNLFFTKYFGFGCPREGFRCKVFPRIDRLKDLGYTPYKEKRVYPDKGTKVFRVVFDRKVSEDGNTEYYEPRLELKESQINRATFDDPNYWQDIVGDEYKAAERVYLQPIAEAYREAFDGATAANKGRIFVIHESQGDIHQVEQAMKEWTTSTEDGFWQKDWRKIVIWDWMGRSKQYERELYKSLRRNYAKIQSMMGEFKFYSLTIDGTSADISEVERIPLNVNKIEPAGNRQTIYDTANSFVLTSTSYEESSKVARLAIKADSMGGKETIYLEVDDDYTHFKEISAERHRLLCPKYWEILDENTKDDVGSEYDMGDDVMGLDFGSLKFGG